MKKVIALDFDGTLCENAWPGIGDPKWAVIRAAQEEQRQGALLILWTTREGPELEQALAWCEYAGLRLDGEHIRTVLERRIPKRPAQDRGHGILGRQSGRRGDH